MRCFLSIVMLLAAASLAHAAAPATFCNPLNLDYGIYQVKTEPPHRHGADPVIVLFKDRYWLFCTWDRPGLRVSDDLANWKYIPFPANVELPGRTYTAAAAIVMDGWLYFTEFGRAARPVTVYRTRDPESGVWERVSDLLPPYADPCLFLDPRSGKLFMYCGLDKPIHGVELDPKTFTEIPGTKTQLMPAFDPTEPIADGWEICTWDNNPQSKPMRGNKTYFPCREGSWMTILDGKYYLQYASPGTTVPGYADGLLVGDNPLGPFTYSQFSPISGKDSGFITSAGHSCLFQDRHGNWWRAVTMLIGVNERMERRIGLFPAGFDRDGIPFTRTELDTPITLPTGERDHAGDVYTSWQPISNGAAMTVSSSLDDHRASLASDEDIRTFWVARSGDAGEWLKLDLSESREIRAVQVNLFEQDCSADVKFEDDVHRFTLAASEDGQTWTTIIDRSRATNASPHTYLALDKPLKSRFLKLTNVATPAGGKFAVSDLRVFGNVPGPVPTAVKELVVRRDGSDRRKVILTWPAAEGAKNYLIRYGIEKDKLYQPHMIRAAGNMSVTLYSLNGQPPYFFRVDAINSAGMTTGPAIAEAP